jgi:hypothetical protein
MSALRLTRHLHKRTGQHRYTLTVPAEISQLLDPDATFAAEVTDDGILYRFVGVVPRGKSIDGGVPEELPDWLKNGAEA